jgi:beta-lactamase regulating signal transducer with metallopeptidase domain
VVARAPAPVPVAVEPDRRVLNNSVSEHLSARVERARAAFDTRVMLVLFWAALSAILLLRLGIANARLTSWEQSSVPVEDQRIVTLLRRACRRHSVRRPVILLESDRTDIPVTWGVIYPVILLPDAWRAWDDEQRTAVLTHELAHVKRFDALTQQLAQAVFAVLWFNPLVWVALRRMRLEREHACDDFVLAGGARATRYADDLLGLARRLARPTAPAAAALAMARRSELEGRLLAILDPKAKRDSVPRVRVAFGVAAALVLSLPLAAFTPAHRAARDGTVASTAPEAAQPAVPPAFSSTTAASQAPDAAAPAPARTVAAETAPLPSPSSMLVPRLVQTPALSRITLAWPDTDPLHPVDLETLIAVTNAAKRMTSDSEKGQLLALIAKRYQRNTELRDAYLEAVLTMTSDDERSKALLALLERDSLPRGAVAQVLRATAEMTSDMSKSTVLQRISPGIYADTAVQRAYLDAIVGMTSDTQRGAALGALIKQNALTAQMQLALLDAIVPMTSDSEKATTLTLFLERQGIADTSVRRAFFSAAETLTSDADYRRLMTAVMK